MQPFRYLGNILGCAGVRFLLGREVRFGLGAGVGRRGLRSRIRVDGGGLVPKMEDARFGSRSFCALRYRPIRAALARCISLRVY